MSGSDTGRPIAGDWYPGLVPRNIVVEHGAHVETSYSFLRFRSRRDDAIVVRTGAALYNPTLDVGPSGRVVLGEHALITSATIICDEEVTIGAMTMIAWGAVVMDSYRGRAGATPRPVCIGSNVWLGFECCVLPGVTIGDGSIIAARAVVRESVPASCVAAGNPARVVRRFAV